MRTVLLFLTLMFMPSAAIRGGCRRAGMRQRPRWNARSKPSVETMRPPPTLRPPPRSRGMFPSPETFIAMVRQGYGAVYRTRRYSVDRIEDAGDDGVALGVTLQDEDGPTGLLSTAWRSSRRRLADHRMPSGQGARQQRLTQPETFDTPADIV